MTAQVCRLPNATKSRRMHRGARSGFTLMEVLVACAVVLLGLAGIAAILPAAASRLAEAAAYDRAAASAAAAMSEIQCRRLASKDVFPSSASGSAVVIGEMLSLTTSTSATSARVFSGTVSITSGTLLSGTWPILSTARAAPLNARINNDISNVYRRGFFVEDEIVYQPASSTPLNSFVNGGREFNRGTCWGALIAPHPWGISSGSMTAARVSVAVFRKLGAASVMTLSSPTTGTAAATGIFTGTIPATNQRRFLRGCSQVLALPPTGTSSVGPQWLSIHSSWVSTGIGSTGAALYQTTSTTTSVVFETPVPTALLSTVGAVSRLSVVGFEGLLLVNEQVLPIP